MIAFPSSKIKSVREYMDSLIINPNENPRFPKVWKNQKTVAKIQELVINGSFQSLGEDFKAYQGFSSNRETQSLHFFRKRLNTVKRNRYNLTMTNKEIAEFLNTLNVHPVKRKIYLTNHHKGILDAIFENTSFLPEDARFCTRVYCVMNDLKGIPLCKECGKKEVKWRHDCNGFNEFCSNKCAHKNPIAETNRCSSLKRTMSSNKVNITKKIKETKLKKYGNENYVNVEKSKKTKLEKYGKENYVNVEKIKKTKLEKYGDENYFNLSKSKKTKLERYGNENYVNVEKAKKTKLEKYGNENYVNVEKGKKTKLERYGDENYVNPDKAKRTKLEKYGDENYYNLEKCLATKEARYGDKWYNNREKNRRTLVERYGVTCNMNTPEAKETARRAIRSASYDVILSNAEDEPTFSREYYVEKSSSDEFEFRCKTCGTLFMSKQSCGEHSKCPKCHPRTSSEGEREVFDFVKTLYGGRIDRNDRSVLKKKELDMYMPELGLAIEYNGLWSHSTGNRKNETYHVDKTAMCEKLGIELVQVFEDDWLYRKEAAKDLIAKKLCVFENVVSADDCEVRNVREDEYIAFMDYNSISPKKSFSNCYGLYSEGMLVMLMNFRFKSLWFDLEDVEELNGTHVEGGFGKLYGKLLEEYFPKYVRYYADKRYWNVGFMDGFGFCAEGDTEPICYVLTKNHLNKIVYDERNSMGDFEGYPLIYDCGKRLYMVENKNDRV